MNRTPPPPPNPPPVLSMNVLCIILVALAIGRIIPAVINVMLNTKIIKILIGSNHDVTIKDLHLSQFIFVSLLGLTIYCEFLIGEVVTRILL